jgi:hypothetical protein
MTFLSRKAAQFTAAEDGGMTGGGLIFIVIFLAVGGLAVDMSNAINFRAQLQMTADSTAHDALYERNVALTSTPDDARDVALALGEQNMNEDYHGQVLTGADIEFGVWNAAASSFTVNENSRTAVRVTTHRDSAGENEVATYLLKFAGFDSWDLRTSAVFETYQPPCLKEGFVAENMVDIQSNNSYFTGFCIHSNDVVSLNSNNYFEAGTIVSMPDTSDLQMPASGLETNIGLSDALRYGAMQIRLINALKAVSSSWSTGKSNMWDFLQLAARDGQIDYITGTPREITVVNGQPKNSTSGDNNAEATKSLKDRNGNSVLRANAVNYVYCSSSSTSLDIDRTVTNLIMITNCKISFGSAGALENGLFATLSTDAKSITGSSSTRIGVKDSCAAGGGGQLVSLGGMNFASGIGINGGQLIALKEIAFAANGDGLKGTSIISGDTVSGTSNMTMGLCGTGMEDNLKLPYFRMVQ